MQRAVACRLLTHVVGDQILVRLTGRRVDLDETNALWLRDRLNALVEAGGVNLSLDLGNVGFLTSTMVEALLGLHRRLVALGGHLCVCNLTPAVAEIFSVLKLAEIFDVRTAPPETGLWN